MLTVFCQTQCAGGGWVVLHVTLRLPGPLRTPSGEVVTPAGGESSSPIECALSLYLEGRPPAMIAAGRTAGGPPRPQRPCRTGTPRASTRGVPGPRLGKGAPREHRRPGRHRNAAPRRGQRSHILPTTLFAFPRGPLVHTAQQGAPAQRMQHELWCPSQFCCCARRWAPRQRNPPSQRLRVSAPPCDRVLPPGTGRPWHHPRRL